MTSTPAALTRAEQQKIASPTFLMWSEFQESPDATFTLIKEERTETASLQVDNIDKLLIGFLWLVVQSHHRTTTSCLNSQQQILLVDLNAIEFYKLFTS